MWEEGGVCGKRVGYVERGWDMECERRVSCKD
mgnify:CR=1 FL=1